MEQLRQNSTVKSGWQHWTIKQTVLFTFAYIWIFQTENCLKTWLKDSPHLEWGEGAWIIWCYCSFTQSCPTLCDSMDYSPSGSPVLPYLLEFAQSHVHGAGDATQPFILCLSFSSCFSLPQHHSLFQWVCSLHQVAKVLELQLQHQSFQWIFRLRGEGWE